MVDARYDEPSSGDRDLRERVAAVVADLGEWDVTPAAWARVDELLARLAQALPDGDRVGVRDAVEELERLGPARAVHRYGEPRLARAPRGVQVVANRMIHELGLPGNGSPLAPPFLVGATAPVTAAVAEQELVVHRFAALDGPHADRAYGQLRRTWLRCQGLFDPRGVGHVPVDVPERLLGVPMLPTIAAMNSRDGGAQAVLWREHDVLVLSVLIGRSADTPDTPDTRWPGWDALWDDTAAGDCDALLGGARLYLGQLAAGSGPPAEIAAALDLDADRATEVAGCVAIDLTAPADPSAERRLIVLCGPDRSADLSALAWSPGDTVGTRLAGYLLHAAKLRYEARVRGSAGAGVADAVATADSRTLTTLMTHLDDLRITTTLARRNMARLLESTPPAGFVADDGELADWLLDQVGADLSYLENERTRRRAGPDRSPNPEPAAPPTVAIVAALPEELAAVEVLLTQAGHDRVPGDPADYIVATMPSADPDRPHRVVLSQFAATATASAAEAVANLIRSYPTVDQVVMVGVAAGIPVPTDPQRHVRLGDILVATKGIVAFDHIVDRHTGPELRRGFPLPSRSLTPPANRLCRAALLGESPWEAPLDRIIERAPAFARPDPSWDVLHDGDGDEVVAHPDPAASGHRAGRPKVHYGALGSADRSLRNAANRDELAQRFGIIGVEMEGAGVGTAAFAAGRGWFVVRGVSDYADRHLDKRWRLYAAAAAAAYVAALLAVCPPIDPH